MRSAPGSDISRPEIRILLLSPHPGRVKAEVIDVDQVSGEDGSAARLEKQIHDLLFADAVTAH